MRNYVGFLQIGSQLLYIDYLGCKNERRRNSIVNESAAKISDIS